MQSDNSTVQSEDRRGFLDTACSAIMAGGLIAGYGQLAILAGRFLYPAAGESKSWMFVTEVASLPPGASISYKSPAGDSVSIAHLSDSGAEQDYVALSSVCPHLGCQTHWEAQNQRFFCPCHNGAFNASGKPIAGPPKDANQSLPQFPLKVENGLLFIEVAVPSSQVSKAV